VQTFRYRQSSLTSPWCMNSSVQGGRDPATSWMQPAGKSSAERTSCQGSGGCGGAQRSEPTGGAAYGIPLYTRTDGSIPVLPSTSPSCTRTASPACVQAENSPTISKTASQGIILQSHKRQPWKSTRRETMIVEGWVS